MIPTDFHFERPLWLLALIPAAFLLWHVVASVGRGSAWRDVVDAHLLRHLALPAEGARRNAAAWLLGAGWLAATIAMAGPSWERALQPTAKTIDPVVVALDMSISMDAEDLTPSRLARARYKLQDVLERSAGGQVGLIIYSDEPFVASPLTDDGRVIAEMIPTLTSDIMPGRGSRPDRAIDQAVALLDQAGVPGGRILVFGDSAGDDPAASRAAAVRAAGSGRTVSVLGVGTADGAPIRDGRGALARTADGELVMARLPTTELESLAASGGGRFTEVTADDADLDVLLAERLSLAQTIEDGSAKKAEVEAWKDAGVYLLLVPVLMAPFAFRRGWLAVVLLGVVVGAPRDASASAWDDLWRTRDQQAAAAFENGDAAAASELFEAPDWRAAAHYESGEYEEAGATFASLPGEENRYNLGNALARGGRLEEAIAAYDEVLEAAPDHEDAKFNRDLVERLLEQQKEQEQQPRQQSQNAEGSEGQPQEDRAQGGEGGGQDQEQSQQGSAGQEQSDQARDSSSDGSGSETSDQASAEAGRDGSEPEEAGDEQQTASAGEQEAGEEEDLASAKSGAAGARARRPTSRTRSAPMPGTPMRRTR